VRGGSGEGFPAADERRVRGVPWGADPAVTLRDGTPVTVRSRGVYRLVAGGMRAS
jgi:hypothetical protein